MRLKDRLKYLREESTSEFGDLEFLGSECEPRSRVDVFVDRERSQTWRKPVWKEKMLPWSSLYVTELACSSQPNFSFISTIDRERCIRKKLELLRIRVKGKRSQGERKSFSLSLPATSKFWKRKHHDQSKDIWTIKWNIHSRIIEVLKNWNNK